VYEIDGLGRADCDFIGSVSTTRDSHNNALAETINGLYKHEVVDYLKED